jgi:Helix-turn-helix domain
MAQVTNPLALRAVAHPLRLKLIGLVGISGTLTATQAAEALDSTPAVTAYHLRTLAKYGFVEDAGSTSARERPWRLTELAVSFSWNDGDPAGQVMSRVAFNEWFEHVRHFQEHKDEYPADVQDASEAAEIVLFASPEEVRELTGKIWDLLEPFRERIDPALRPPGIVPMEMLVFTHPVVPPGFATRDTKDE